MSALPHDPMPLADAAGDPVGFDPARLQWRHRYAALGPAYRTELAPTPVPSPAWVATSPACARWMGLPEDWSGGDAVEVFSGNALWPGMAPVATVYSGHQFGVWAGQLGDGRALLLGELDTPAGPLEVQLKGAGRTPYSRMGDGRAVLRSSIREFLCSEAMAALGIPTTRALCLAASPLPVRRETVETAAVVTRVAPSFIRFGHFEHFTHSAPDADHATLRRLVDHVIEHHHPACREAANPAAALLATVARLTGELMAAWQSVGFCHGVMNTDNMSILGLTIDYGPFGFLDAFDPGHICNHSDHQGRYAYARQPSVGFWNVQALAHALMPLIGEQDEALSAIEGFKDAFQQAFHARMHAKLGLTPREGDWPLIEDLLRRMAADRADFTLVFRRLSGLRSVDDAPSPATEATPVRDLFIDREAFDAWAVRYRERLRAEGSDDRERAARMNAVNPKFVLRNHLCETAIERARDGDYAEVQRLLRVLERPFDEQPEHDADAALPPDWASSIEVSCSS
jgi:uncharacterized protein YdiU (UPF0061 family)